MNAHSYRGQLPHQGHLNYVENTAYATHSSPKEGPCLWQHDHSFGYDLPVRFWRISDGLPVLPVIHQKCPRAVLAVHTRVARMMYELDRYCSGGAANRFIQRGGQESG